MGQDPIQQFNQITKTLTRINHDLDELNPAKHGERLLKEGAAEIQKGEILLEQSGWFEHEFVVEGLNGKFDGALKVAQMVLEAAQTKMSQNETAISESESHLLTMRADDALSTLTAAREKIPGLQHSLSIAESVRQEWAGLFQKAQSGVAEWERLHPWMLTLKTLVAEWNAKEAQRDFVFFAVKTGEMELKERQEVLKRREGDRQKAERFIATWLDK